MKRYGYKFEKGDAGPAKFDGLRAYILFSPIVYIALASLFTTQGYGNDTRIIMTSYIFTGFILILITMLAELLPKIGIAIFLAFCVTVVGGMYFYRDQALFEPRSIIMAIYLTIAAVFATYSISKLRTVNK